MIYPVVNETSIKEVLRIRIPFFADPDPGKNLNPDLDAGSDL
jgi:hypothetical protein